MKNIIKNSIYILLILSLFNCSDEYFDINTPSGAAGEEQLKMADLIGPATKNTFLAQYYASRSLSNYSQYITGIGGGATGMTSLSGTWSTIYLGSLPDLNVIIAKSEEKNAIHFGAVAKILKVVNLGILTDNYDNIPYSEAAQFGSNLQPAFDSQMDIYATIDILLNEAISALSSTDTSGQTILNDMIYGGDTDKWLRLAYTLKARYKMHLIERNGVSMASDALASLVNGFSGNGDDFKMSYTGGDLNPWFVREISARATGNNHDKVGDQLVSYMDGTSYPFATVSEDPRLDALFVRLSSVAPDVLSPVTDPWRGFVSGGDGLSSDGMDGNVNFKNGGFYSNSGTPIEIITNAEALFLKAEAAFLANGGTSTSVGSNAVAYTAYLDGITASMSKIGVDGSAYLADASIAVGEAGLMLHHIMKEKYIANFLNSETFVDLRRYNFSTDVFKDLALPADNADGEYPGQWLIRTSYPSSESIRNPNNVNANKKEPTEPVWWDM